MLLGMLTACSGGMDAENTDEGVTLRLAHNQNEKHPVHKSLVEFSELVKEKTNGQVKIKLYPNGQLGSEREVIELTQTGAVDIAKVSASALESFEEVYSIFSVPYLFDNKEHYYKVMDSGIAKEIYQSTKDIGFIGLTWYDAGSRNFYTKNTPIMKPEDLNGLKIRVQPSQTVIRMVELMGGAPTPMAYGEVYTAIQQGVIDGAENNVTALTNSKHGEVAKHFSFDEHSFVPDTLIMNLSKWDKLSDEQKKAVTEAAKESTEYHKKVWAKAVKHSIEKAKKMGVHFYYPEKEPFQIAVKPLHEKFAKQPSTAEYYKRIRGMAKDK